jgi:WD40 repeat protein
MKLDTT